ncbi:MAG: acyl-CoA transferase, partial [Pseudomonadota bacterium]
MTDQLLAHIAAALPHTPARVPCRIGASGGLPSWFDVTGLAAASIGAAGAEIAALAGVTDELSVDARLASLWFDMTVRPCGWTLPS